MVYFHHLREIEDATKAEKINKENMKQIKSQTTHEVGVQTIPPNYQENFKFYGFSMDDERCNSVDAVIQDLRANVRKSRIYKNENIFNKESSAKILLE